MGRPRKVVPLEVPIEDNLIRSIEDTLTNPFDSYDKKLNGMETSIERIADTLAKVTDKLSDLTLVLFDFRKERLEYHKDFIAEQKKLQEDLQNHILREESLLSEVANDPSKSLCSLKKYFVFSLTAVFVIQLFLFLLFK